MLLRCTRTFETRETGVPYTVSEGTVWQRSSHKVAMGGYEIAVMDKVESGRYTDTAQIRVERLVDHFELVPPGEIGMEIGPSVPMGRC